MVNFGIGLPNSVNFEILKKITLKCQKLGFESVWTGDHLRNSIESWSLLTGLASNSERIRLGTLCTCVSYRYPVLLAKIIASADIISNGRINLGIGAGWVEDEYEVYGLQFDKPSLRIKQLRETIQIVKKLWMENKVYFKGEFWNINGAIQVPKPVQKPYPPIWICLYGKILLKLVAELADGWNTGMCTPEEYKKKISLLKQYCISYNRNIEKINNSFFTSISIIKNQTLVDKKLKKFCQL